MEACHWFQCGHQFSPDDDISVSFVLLFVCIILQDLTGGGFHNQLNIQNIPQLVKVVQFLSYQSERP